MGDSSAGGAGERFIAEFGEDYARRPSFDPDTLYAVEGHGLVYDDFHREVKYGVTLRPANSTDPNELVELILDEPAAYDPEHGDWEDEIDRVARDLGLSHAEVLVRFKRAGLVDEEFSLADFTMSRERGE